MIADANHADDATAHAAQLLSDTALEQILNSVQDVYGPIHIIERIINPRLSTSASEVVTCEMRDGRHWRLLCKYGAIPPRTAYEYRGGVPYEAYVYEHVLRSLQLSLPRFITACTQAPGTTLIVEFINHAHRLSETEQENAIFMASRWIGRFHRATTERRFATKCAELIRYDEGYYQRWVRQIIQCRHTWERDYPWLATVANTFMDRASCMVADPLPVIHGEYYPKNILLRADDIYPVDWESAAIGAGEIDLATITEGWSEEATRRCIDEYCAARWNGFEPVDFSLRLGLARLYSAFRWLATRLAQWPKESGSEVYIHQVQSAAAQLGWT